ncbi:MAG: hypothetical protein R3B89_06295 [Polyangiaceae bacterium]
MRVPAWVVVALGCAGCTTPEQSPNAVSSTARPAPAVSGESPVARATAVEVAPPPPQVRLAAEEARYLASSGVTRGDYVRSEFFTWTTKAQLGELRSRRRLLLKDRADDGSRAFFDRRLELMRDSADVLPEQRLVARRLLEPDLGLRRFAWVNPWGTARGWGESDTYGHVLVKVRLKPRALLARLDGNGWEFRDQEGRIIQSDAALDAELVKRLAVVFHSWDPEAPGDGMRELEGRPAFREFVLVNESMLESWEVDTTAVRERVERDRKLMRAIAPQVSQPPPSWHTELAERWSRIEAASDPGADFDQRYAACLAFSSKDYAPDQADEIAQELAKAERGGALDVRVNVAFGEPVVRPQPVIKNHRPAGWRRPILW